MATALAVPGILLTAALLVRALQRMFLGPLRLPDSPGTPRPFPDLRAHEAAAIVPLLALAVVLGVFPRFVLDVVEPFSRTVLELVAR